MNIYIVDLQIVCATCTVGILLTEHTRGVPAQQLHNSVRASRVGQHTENDARGDPFFSAAAIGLRGRRLR